jgi:hypothetical protein
MSMKSSRKALQLSIKKEFWLMSMLATIKKPLPIRQFLICALNQVSFLRSFRFLFTDYNSKTRTWATLFTNKPAGTTFLEDVRNLARAAPKIAAGETVKTEVEGTKKDSDSVETAAKTEVEGTKKDFDLLPEWSYFVKSDTEAKPNINTSVPVVQPKTEVTTTPEVDKVITDAVKKLSDDLKKQTEEILLKKNDPLLNISNRPSNNRVPTSKHNTLFYISISLLVLSGLILAAIGIILLVGYLAEKKQLAATTSPTSAV